MTLALLAIGVLVLSGLGTLVVQRSALWSTRIGLAGALAGCILGLAPALRILLGAAPEAIRLPWAVPYGSFCVGMDALSAFFLLIVFGLPGLAAVYGAEYLLAYRPARRLGPPWFSFNLLVASMAMTVLARNAILFLVAWEVMSLASFFLVTFEDEKAEVRDAGWTYLIATHLGTAFLLALFILLGRGAGTLDFDGFGSGAALSAGGAALLFGLGVVGFGTKAGFMPFHVWLPEAHPAAPSHVSAVMSGVMIKMGIYGLLRLLTFLGAPPVGWGWLLIGIGITSGVFGVLLALAQHDLKRLLAYHSVENIGIIALGLGIGLLGVHYGSPTMAILGFGGGLLHVINHAIFKGLLFLGAGAVGQAAGTREIDHLGGLLKRMPFTGVAFLVGAVSISGLPPFNGFVSEFLIFLGALKGVVFFGARSNAPFVSVLAALGLIGGLAAACFTKVFGVAFLGEPRSEAAAKAREAGLLMRLPMMGLAGLCLLIGIAAPFVLGALGNVLACLLPPSWRVQEDLGVAAVSLRGVVSIAMGLALVTGSLAVLRRRLLRGRPVGESGTWDCGYARPSARMQYTASSFAEPLIRLFRVVLRTRKRILPPEGIFPREASFSSETPDFFQENLYARAFAWIEGTFSKFRWMQQGRVQLYVLYIMVTLLVLLVWELG